MYGLPETAEQRISDELEMALSLPITHLSTYALSIEKGTPFAKKKIVSPEDATWQEYLQIRERLAQAGFQHYEISAFAKPGHTCIHNLAYWTLSPYIGIGPSAASYWRGMSYKNVSDLARYVENPRPPIAKKTPEFSVQNMAADYMITNFRRLNVIDTTHISQDLGIDAEVVYAEVFHRLLSQGWLTKISPTHYKITDEGIRMHNYLLEVFV
jgi:oxygen-independent coproporphyrinogen III oxidase